MSVNFVMRAIPEDSELMRLVLADAPDVRHVIFEFLFETCFWRFSAELPRYRQAFPELLDLHLDGGKWKRRNVDDVLLGMAQAPVTPDDRELVALVEHGQPLFGGRAGLVPATRVEEVARFLALLDPALGEDERRFLDSLRDFYRRVASVPGLAVIVAHQ